MKENRQSYSQSKALWDITRASFTAIFANPSAIIFSILFPIIFTLGEAEVRALAEADEKVKAALAGKPVKKFVFVPKRLVNFVV